MGLKICMGKSCYKHTKYECSIRIMKNIYYKSQFMILLALIKPSKFIEAIHFINCIKALAGVAFIKTLEKSLIVD